jgi:hypothetical protein
MAFKRMMREWKKKRVRMILGRRMEKALPR